MESLISEKAARVLDLLEQIESVNEMIHKHEGDTFMQGQYQYRKQLFVQELAGKLKEFDIHPQDLAA
ncbi:MAG: hypothetical protein AAF804_09930 [Bacteroidota bacterium]